MMAYTIALPTPGQNVSASLFGKAVRDAIIDLDSRTARLEVYTTGKPVGKIAQTASQNLASNTNVALQFPAADILDTHAQHNPASNNTRVTPNVAGVYRFAGVAYTQGRTDFIQRGAWFRKNGVDDIYPAARKGAMSGAAVNVSIEIDTIESMNGSTDYMEFMTIQQNTAAVTISTQVALQYATVVTWELIREPA